MNKQRPNIVLICVDQWRGDCLSIDHHPVVHTPWLDQLATEGARFRRAYAACPTCIAARTALYTGMSQRRHGRVGYKDGVPWNYPHYIASVFSAHDYQTQAIGKLHVFPERSQIGFQNVILHDGFLHHSRGRESAVQCLDDYVPWLSQQLGRSADYFEHGVNCNSMVARPWDKDEYLHPTTWVVTQGLEFLRRRDPRKPFFLLLSFHRPHPPYDPPAWAFEQYLHAPMPPVPVGDWAGLFDPHRADARPATGVAHVAPHLLQRARAGYYGHMSHIDHQINRFLEAFRDHKIVANTCVAFVSDHGELMGDHHLWQKALPYEGSARVPLIIKGPAECGITPGCTLDQPVELRDVMPTLLECAGLPIPETVEGQSLWPLLRGEKVAWRPYVHGEHVKLEQSVQFITDGRAKYVWFSGSGHEQFFDLEQDPQELHDLSAAPAHTDRIGIFREWLIRELTGREEGFTDGHHLIAGRPVQECLAHVRQASR